MLLVEKKILSHLKENIRDIFKKFKQGMQNNRNALVSCKCIFTCMKKKKSIPVFTSIILFINFIYRWTEKKKGSVITK